MKKEIGKMETVTVLRIKKGKRVYLWDGVDFYIKKSHKAKKKK